ncbi:hypothetical protein GGI04_001867 [Coemansia thaxteri]|nr:hypothetical protein GGI04_001867 [Coemansia thaxteri]KAJ2472217.1 hypothetical protein GGI02_001738 [Coemansia sp. RSA 2322]
MSISRAARWIPLHRAVQRIAFKLRAPQRLLLCVRLYGSLALLSQELARLAAESLLAHIRQAAGDQLFTMLCVNGVAGIDGGDGDERMLEIEQVLSETDWVQDSTSVKESRGRLAELVRQVLGKKGV